MRGRLGDSDDWEDQLGSPSFTLGINRRVVAASSPHRWQRSCCVVERSAERRGEICVVLQRGCSLCPRVWSRRGWSWGPRPVEDDLHETRRSGEAADERNLGSSRSPRVTAGDPADENIRAVARLEESARSSRSVAACVSDTIIALAGSEWSVTLHALWFACWLVVNTGLSPLKPFDPFPFSLLTSIVSLEAIFLTLLVLASQNRLTREADKRAHLDLQVNLLAEQEMTVVLHMLRELCDRFDLTATTQSDAFRALVKQLDVGSLAARVETTLTPTTAAPAPQTAPSLGKQETT